MNNKQQHWMSMQCIATGGGTYFGVGRSVIDQVEDRSISSCRDAGFTDPHLLSIAARADANNKILNVRMGLAVKEGVAPRFSVADCDFHDESNQLSIDSSMAVQIKMTALEMQLKSAQDAAGFSPEAILHMKERQKKNNVLVARSDSQCAFLQKVLDASAKEKQKVVVERQLK
jgi:hypothetical protein